MSDPYEIAAQVARDFPLDCEHSWFDIPDPGGYVGEECRYCGQNKANAVDPVKKPEHYNWHPSGVECKDIAEAFNYYLGNAIKYIWRADYKGKPIEDLQKARNCIDLELQRRAKQ